jgi:trehalose 6-phosphate phosphatase
MRHLFSPEGEHALEAVMRLRPLLAFDFDGTLAPIVPRRDGARVSKAVSRWIGELSAVSSVAIVTGRSVADVAPRLGFEPQFIVGNHGGEDPAGCLPPGEGSRLDPLRGRLARHAAALSEAGVQVEDKQYSLALHYRLARNRALANARIFEVLGELGPDLRTFAGQFVVNVVPAGAPDKGEAVASLLRASGAAAAVFVGDDLTDETVFARAEYDWLTVRIGREDRACSARFFLDSHSEVATLLQRMLLLLRQP